MGHPMAVVMHEKTDSSALCSPLPVNRIQLVPRGKQLSLVGGMH